MTRRKGKKSEESALLRSLSRFFLRKVTFPLREPSTEGKGKDEVLTIL